MASNNRRYCDAQKSDGKPCRLPAGFRTKHPGVGNCFRHGGAAPSGFKHAMKLLAKQAVDTYGLSREVDPHTALLEEVWRTAGHVEWLGAMVRKIDEASLAFGKTEEVVEVPIVATVNGDDGGDDHDAMKSNAVKRTVKFGVDISVWLKMYQIERRHLVDVCRTAIACGIAERHVRLAEEQGKMIAGVISGVLSDLGVDRDAEEVRESMRKHLMLAAGTIAQ
jgi:hypothetical protein